MCARARRVPRQRVKTRIGPRSATGAAALRAGGKGHRAGRGAEARSRVALGSERELFRAFGHFGGFRDD
jgi:hypothetical protein